MPRRGMVDDEPLSAAALNLHLPKSGLVKILPMSLFPAETFDVMMRDEHSPAWQKAPTVDFGRSSGYRSRLDARPRTLRAGVHHLHRQQAVEQRDRVLSGKFWRQRHGMAHDVAAGDRARHSGIANLSRHRL